MKAIFEATQYDKVVALLKVHHDKYPKLREVLLTGEEWEHLLAEMKTQGKDVTPGMSSVVIGGVYVRVVR